LQKLFTNDYISYLIFYWDFTDIILRDPCILNISDIDAIPVPPSTLVMQSVPRYEGLNFVCFKEYN